MAEYFAAGNIVGTVLDLNDDPIPGVTVEAFGGNCRSTPVITLVDGTYDLDIEATNPDDPLGYVRFTKYGYATVDPSPVEFTSDNVDISGLGGDDPVNMTMELTLGSSSSAVIDEEETEDEPDQPHIRPSPIPPPLNDVDPTLTLEGRTVETQDRTPSDGGGGVNSGPRIRVLPQIVSRQ